jgi:cysteine-rich repeat protein
MNGRRSCFIVLLLVALVGCGGGGGGGDEGPLCGDGVVEAGEECDDGNAYSGDGCTAFCEIEAPAVCGNGYREGAEECDDGNLQDGDGCSASCRAESGVCGDGITGGYEQCDDGNLEDGDGCDHTCARELPFPRVCGDGLVSGDEECDDGRLNSDTHPSSCRADCRKPRCGDGVVDLSYGLIDFHEECDDGNLEHGDGCDENCRVEGPTCARADVLRCDAPLASATDAAGSTQVIDVYPGVPGSAAGPEIAYLVAVERHADVTIIMDTAEPALRMLVLESGRDVCAPVNLIAHGDASVTFSVEGDGHFYYLVVDGWDGAAAPFTLTAACRIHEQCWNGRDDDGDVWSDCDDPDCVDAPECQ